MGIVTHLVALVLLPIVVAVWTFFHRITKRK
jgi:hypothetical protein